MRITRAPLGITRTCPETRALLQQAMQEIYTLAAARGVTLPADVASETLAWIDTMPPTVTTSMQRDIMEGRPSELDAQSGAVVSLAKAARIDVPVHRFI